MCRASPTSAGRYAIERAPFPRSSTNTLPGRPQFENSDLSEVDLSKWDISRGRKFKSMVRARPARSHATCCDNSLYPCPQFPKTLSDPSLRKLTWTMPKGADTTDMVRQLFDAPAVFNLTPDVLPQFEGVVAYANNELDTAKLPLRDRILLSSDAQIAEFDVSKETDFRGLVRMRPSPTAPCNH